MSHQESGEPLLQLRDLVRREVLLGQLPQQGAQLLCAQGGFRRGSQGGSQGGGGREEAGRRREEAGGRLGPCIVQGGRSCRVLACGIGAMFSIQNTVFNTEGTVFREGGNIKGIFIQSKFLKSSKEKKIVLLQMSRQILPDFFAFPKKDSLCFGVG